MPCDDAVGRVQRAERVLEDHRHALRYASTLPPGPQVRQRPPLEPDLAARRPVDPGQQPGDGALPAAALADQGDDLPARRWRSRRRRRRAGCRGAAARRHRKCRDRPRASNSGARSSRRRSRSAHLLVPARVVQQAAGRDAGHVVQRRVDGLARVKADRAARLEAAAGRQRCQARRTAGDPLQRHPRPGDRRERVQQPAAVRMRRGVEHLPGGPNSIAWPAYITISRSEK